MNLELLSCLGSFKLEISVFRLVVFFLFFFAGGGGGLGGEITFRKPKSHPKRTETNEQIHEMW